MAFSCRCGPVAGWPCIHHDRDLGQRDCARRYQRVSRWCRSPRTGTGNSRPCGTKVRCAPTWAVGASCSHHRQGPSGKAV